MAASAAPTPTDSRAQQWLTLLFGWHLVLAIGGLAAAALVGSGSVGEPAAWLRVLGSGLLTILGIASAAAVVAFRQRDHRGRLLSLTINYLGFLFCFIGTLHVAGFFTGLDGVADRFAGGLPFLIGVLAGILIRSRSAPTGQGRQIGRAVTLLSIAGFLLSVGLLDGLLGLLNSLRNPTALALLAGVFLFGAMAWGMWRRPVAALFGATNAQGELLDGYLFLSPNLLGFLVFFAGPLVLSLYVSFTNSDAFGNAEWIGLDNYAEIFNLDFATLDAPDQLASEVIDTTTYTEVTRVTLFGRSFVVGAEDKLFWLALGNTLQFVLFAVPLSVIPALFLANLLNSKIPGMAFFRAVYFLPSVAAVVGISLVWQWLYNATIGYINYFITLGVDLINVLGLSVVDPQIRWLSESSTALLAVIIMAAWQWIGFNTVLFLAGLQNIPKSLYEAATVDGASPRTQFWRITLPLLAPTTFFVVTTTVIQAMQVFEQVFILIPGQNPAGPQNSTLTIVLYLYQKGFQRFEQGYASAIAWVLFLLIFGATLFQFQRQRAGGEA